MRRQELPPHRRFSLKQRHAGVSILDFSSGGGRGADRPVEGDTPAWGDTGTRHDAHADYRPDAPRLFKRCQVMADRIFDSGFVRATPEAGAARVGLIAMP